MFSEKLPPDLFKKGSKFGILHRRYCQLIGTKMLVWRKKDFTKKDKEIELTADTLIWKATGSRGHLFTMILNNGSCLTFGSKDESIRDVWVNALKTVILSSPHMTMDCFNIISVLGKGYFGKVLLCQRKNTTNLYAIKTIHKKKLVEENKIHTVLVEREVLMKSNHPFIVRIEFAFSTESKLYLGLEYVPGGELRAHWAERGRLLIEEVRLYVAEIALALDYLHQRGVIYRDLKGENVLLDAEGHVKLADFGLAKIINSDIERRANAFCGTPEFIAPEVIERKPYGPEIDWWALGVLTYQMVFGAFPFRHSDHSKLYELVVTEEPRFAESADPVTVDFIKKLLIKDPENRMKFQDLSRHEFFAGLSFRDVLEKKIHPLFIPPMSDRDVAPGIDSLASLPGEKFDSAVFDGFGFLKPPSRRPSTPDSTQDIEESSGTVFLDGSPQKLQII